ncbi:uncharacterized protein LOC116246491 [Nymphaea colorata]|uniref:uncharacterized protein LOC116246491 n=1 Tax=Nymphaea colorata TaxID=210225 RepID=UPI00129EB760|nr:uncharacterized protein LOC116246491 [Nymphaea colorata]
MKRGEKGKLSFQEHKIPKRPGIEELSFADRKPASSPRLARSRRHTASQLVFSADDISISRPFCRAVAAGRQRSVPVAWMVAWSRDIHGFRAWRREPAVISLEGDEAIDSTDRHVGQQKLINLAAVEKTSELFSASRFAL